MSESYVFFDINDVDVSVSISLFLVCQIDGLSFTYYIHRLS